MKRFISIFLTVVFILSAVAGIVPYAFAAEDSPAETPVEKERPPFTSIETGCGDTDLFAAYVDRAFSKQPEMIRSVVVGADSLTSDTDKMVYKKLSGYIKQVAAGERSSTEFLFTLSDFSIEKDKYTAEDLGVSSLLESDGENWYISEEAEKAMNSQVLSRITFDADTVIGQLLFSYPYELYWFNKTYGYAHFYSSIQFGADDDHPDGYLYLYPLDGIDAVAELALVVSEEFSLDGQYFQFDTTIGQSVQTAAANARAVVSKHASKTDYEKVVAYKDEICSLVDYNYDAAEDETMPYGNPWQLIWVFDGDDSTNVVCEGYSKAFQYLCQLSDFESNDVACISVIGQMVIGASSELHMWNILCMDDGLNYLVDVTNCDNGTIGYPDQLFLKGANGGLSTYYYINCYGISTCYYYDDFMSDLLSEQSLSVSPKDYVVLVPGASPYATLTGASLTFEDKIYINYKMLDPGYTGWYAELYYEQKDGGFELVRTVPIGDETWREREGKHAITFSDIPAKEMTRKLKIKVFDAECNMVPLKIGVNSSNYKWCYDYTAATWAKNKQKSTEPYEAVFARSLLAYGRVAQDYFQYNLVNPADGEVNVSDIRDEMASVTVNPAYTHDVSQAAVTAGLKSASPVFESALNINVKFSRIANVKIDNEPRTLDVYSDGVWYTVITRIPAKEMHKLHTITVDGIEAHYGALSWANSMLTKTNVEARDKQMARAMYVYNKYARLYFGYEVEGLQ